MKAEWSNKDSLEMPTTTMSDYIKREDAIKYVDKQEGREFTGCTIAEMIKAIIKEVPSADVVEVVRCKDCKYFRIVDSGDVCTNWHGGMQGIKRDDYCSYGERKDNE